MIRASATALVAVAVLLLLIAEVQCADAALEADQARVAVLAP